MSAEPITPIHDPHAAVELGVPRPVDGLPIDELRESPERFINRELSWLDFDARVLALAADPRQPLLERAKFLAIFSQNLDEFFQVRVAGLKDQVAAGLGKTTPDGRSAGHPARRDPRPARTTCSALAEAHLRRRHRPRPGRRTASCSPASTTSTRTTASTSTRSSRSASSRCSRPLAVDPGHPFPYISDLSLNLAVVVHDPVSGDRRFARVKVPNLLPRFVVMPDGERFVPLEQVIAAHLDVLFPGMEPGVHYAFRVTRNADLTLEEEEADDLLEAVELELRRRRFGRAVRLEVDAEVSEEILDLLTRELDLAPDDVYHCNVPLDLGGLWAVQRPRPARAEGRAVGAHHPAPAHQPRARRAGRPVLGHPRRRRAGAPPLRVVLQLGRGVHPPGVARPAGAGHQAHALPHVLATPRSSSRWCGPPRAGKQVAALVELKARFDEKKNIGWAKELEKAGVHVVYGLMGLKIHTKTTLVVREEADGIRRYCHIGTGNYNPKTARLYEDLGLLTADPEIGSDLTQLFNLLTGFAREPSFNKLLVSPSHRAARAHRAHRERGPATAPTAASS